MTPHQGIYTVGQCHSLMLKAMPEPKERFAVVARGACLQDNHLLVAHDKEATNTHLPGGHLEPGETAVDAVVREIEEELALSAHVRGLLGVVEIQSPVYDFTQVSLVFEIDIDGVDPSRNPPSAEDHLEFFWVPLEKLRDHNLLPDALIPGLQGRSAGAFYGVSVFRQTS